MVQCTKGGISHLAAIEIHKAKIEHYLHIDSRTIKSPDEFAQMAARAAWIDENKSLKL